MSQSVLTMVWLCVPILCGAVVAITNSGKANDVTEAVEAWTRRRNGILSVKKGICSKWIFRPPVWIIVKLSDWTNSLRHRGVKSGIHIAAGLYILGLWLLLLVYALALFLALILAAVVVVVALWIMGEMLGNNRNPRFPQLLLRPKPVEASDEDYLLRAAGRRGQNTYAGANWLNEELKGRVDGKGNIYTGTNWPTEERIGKIDRDGNIYRGTSWLNEELVGRVDKDGSIAKGTNWINEEKVGRIDQGGNVFAGTNWLNEKKIGRSGK